MRAVLAGVLLAGPALAQPGPRVLPDRDVTVVYQAAGAAVNAVPGGAPGPIQVEWQAAGQRLRVDAGAGLPSLLVDLDAATVLAVDSRLRAAMPLPVRPGDLQPLNLANARMQPRGRESVAGRPCTDYQVDARRGHGVVCLTEDGVALRADGEVDGKQGSFTAVSISYRALPPGLFEVPPDYMQLALPGLSRRR